MKCQIKDMQGKEAGSLDLDPQVFGVKPNEAMVHQMVRWQRAKRRAGTHATLTRSEIKGGAKKPWKQKGTGRARAGSSVSPLWVGGAVVFGPQPRDYEFRMPKRSRRIALASVLSDKAQQGNLVVVKDLALKNAKTAEMNKALDKLGVAGKKVLLVVDGENAEKNPVWLASRNIKGVKPIALAGVNVYDIVNADVLIVAEKSVSDLQRRVQGTKAER